MGDSLHQKLSAARRRWRSVTAFSGFAVALAGCLALALASFYIDRIVVLTPQGRLLWLIGILGGSASALVAFVTLPLARRLPDEVLAVTVERRFPTLAERLISTVELAHAGAAAGTSNQLVGALARDTEGLAGSLDFRRAVDSTQMRRSGFLACAAALVFIGHAALMPAAMSTWLKRLLHPSADIPIYARTLVWVTPADTVIPRGEPVMLGVRVGGRPAPTAVLHYRFDGAAWSTAQLSSPRVVKTGNDDLLAFDFKIGEAQQSITYFARAGDGQSNPHTVRVEDRPTVLGVKVRLEYPAYTRLPAQTITATAGNIVAPVGTRAAIEATANKPLRDATFVEDGHIRGSWPVNGSSITGSVTVRRDESYSLHLKDRNGFVSQNPPIYTVRAQPDRPPTVQVLRPGADIDRSPLGSVLLKVAASDDYGISSLALAYRTGKRTGSLPLPGSNGGKQTVVGGSWSLANLGLKAGDTITYEADARDNDAVDGPHVGRSASYRIHILGLEEMRERLDAQQAAEREALRQLVAAQKAAQAALSQARSRPAQRDLAAQAEAAQRAIAQAASDLASRMQSTTEQMHDNLAGSQVDIQRREHVQQSLHGLSQRQMPAAAESIKRNQMGSAAQQEQGIREELERLTLEMAPAPQIPQLAQEADRLAQEQQKLAEQSDLAAEQTQGKSPDQMTPQQRARTGQLARQQAAVRSQTQALQQALSSAAQDASQRGSQEAQDLHQASQQLAQSGAQQNQQSAQRNLQASKPAEASPQQNAAAKALRDLANQLDEAGQRQANQSLESKARRLDAASERLMQMANQERGISRQAQNNPNPQQSQQLAQQQQSLLSQAHQMDSALQDAPAAASAMRNAQGNMQQAQSNLSKGTPRDAYQPAQQATTQLLRAAKEAMDAANAMKEEQEARQAEHQVQQLAREQRATERQTRQLDTARKGAQQLTPDQQKRAQQLAQTQEKLLQRGREMREDMPSQGFKAALDQATSRMDDATRALQQQNTSPETQRSQEHAAQRLERIARALGQKAQGAQQQAQGGGQQGGADQDMAEASGDLQLAREMEQQIRQETAGINQRRNANPNRNLTAQQQRELNWLAQGQRETRQVAEDAAQKLRGAPEIGQTVQKAAEEMDDVEDMLRRTETGEPTQGRQERIVGMLDRALQQTRQAMRDQRQQQMAQRQQSQGQQRQAQSRPGGTQPAARTYAPIEQAQNASFGQSNMRGRGFGALSPRAQQALREGQQERVPAEYRDLVNQYYKALSEHAH